MAVDVGSAVGYLDLDISGFLSNIKSAQSEASNAANDISQKIGDSMKSIGEGMTKVGTFATAGITTPIVTAVTASVKQFANLEQSIGGVETLFKSSAQGVISNAETAYKRAGVDANSYMEQVTSFSATLLQGLGGDTEKAAAAADKAIVDMSDNANKMGTDISLIQNAYQGFAKDNYTMLDNLKLGYGGTAGEMARLVNDSGVLNGAFEATAANVKDIPFDTLIEAIHKTQENLGITGTTAKEAEATVSGSFGMMKSSVLNFLQQMGNPGADTKKFAQEMIKSTEVFVGNVKRVLATIWDNLPISPLQKKLLVAAAAFGPVMIAGGKVISTVGSIASGVGKAIPLISQFSAGFASAGASLAEGASSMTSFGAAVGASLGPILIIVGIIALLVAAFKHLWETNEEFRNKITGIWDGIKQKFEEFVQGIVDRLNALGFDFDNFTEVIKTVWETFCNILAPIFEGVFSQISNIISTTLDIITGILDVFIGLFTGNWEQCWNGIKEIFGAVIDFIKNTFQNFANTLKGIADVVLGLFGTNWDNCFNSIKQLFTNVWNGIVSFFTSIVESIKTGVSDFVTTVVNFFTKLAKDIADSITNAYNSVVTWVSNMVAKAIELGQSFLNAVVESFTELVNKISNFIGSILADITAWVSNMVAKAREMGTNFLNNVVSFMTQLPGKIKQQLDSAIDKLKTWVTQMGEKGKEAVTSLIDNVMSAAKDIATKVMSIGSDIVSGVWNGILAAKDAFISNVTGFFSDIVDSAKDALGIASPSKVFRDEVGKWLPPGIAKGFEAAMPAAMNDIEKDLNKGINNIDVKDITVGAEGTVSGFTDKLKSVYGDVALWFESIESRINNSIGNMAQSLNVLTREGQAIINSDGTLGYIGYNGFTNSGVSERYVDRSNGNSNDTTNGDTFIFNSPKAIDEVEAARLLKRTKRDLSEGFL